jgi:molecular chaperone GrpE
MSDKDSTKAPVEETVEKEVSSDKEAQENSKEAVEETASDVSPDAESKQQESADEASEEPNWKDMYARMLADFDNYRKRVSRDREELVKFAASETVKDMLVTADNLALAIGQAKDLEDPFVKGVQLAYDSFLKSLKDHGAEPFESVGEDLDPNRHEAIATLPSDTVEEGKISTEVKKGWMLNGRLLRAAQVVVSSGPAK